jgi:hypothetical protein
MVITSVVPTIVAAVVARARYGSVLVTLMGSAIAGWSAA